MSQDSMSQSAMLRRVVVALLGLTLLALSPAFGQRDVIIGEHVPYALETPHPYPTARAGAEEPVWVDYIQHPGAVYISVHFAEFELAEGDHVVVRSQDGVQQWHYTGLGKRDLGRTKEGFYAAHIKGDTAIVELFAHGRGLGTGKALDSGTDRDERFGYRIDFYGRGYNDFEIQDFWDRGLGEEMNLPYPPSLHKSLCGTDDSLEAKCYQASEPAAYNTSTSVARLIKSGLAHCTGWLVGCEGHLMTNEHCIGSQTEANQIDFEFMAEGASCATSCTTALGCPGTVEASGATLVQLDAPLDYALVIPDTSTASSTDLPATYGYMQLRDTGPVNGEQIYIPQHPAGWGKRLALESSHSVDQPSGLARISSVTETGCQSAGIAEVGYYADTQGGSSGSPVLGYSDNLVVALHHCRGSAACTGTGGDPNRGVAIDDIISDLGANLPNCALGSGNNLPSVSITAPADGSIVDQGTNVAFSGTANDVEDGDLTSSLSWSSSIDGVIGSGGSFSTSGLSLGSHTITASVTDSGGAPASDTINLTIKDPNSNGPQTAVYDGALGAPVCNIAGSSCDSGSLLDGRANLGPEVNQPNTLDGCTDGTSGSYHSDESNDRIVVTNLSGSDLAAGATVEVAATVWAWSTGSSDTLDLYYAADANSPSWVLIGSLVPPGGGAQTITAQYTLPSGSLQAVRANFRYQGSQGSCTTGSYDDADDLVFAVGGGGPVNTAPTVSITAPADGSSSNSGNSVSFTGTANDTEDGDLSASLSWSSSLDGSIGSGASFSTSSLSVGTHTITASVTDSGSLSGSDSISVTVNSISQPVTVTFTSIGAEDGWTRESNETSNVGGSSNPNGSGSRPIRPGDANQDRQYKSILSFDTSSLPDGATIQSVTFRLRRGTVRGLNPFTNGFGQCLIDVNSGGFSGSTALQPSDFEAAATATASASMSAPASNGDWSEGTLDAAGRAAVNLTGTTQVRVYFEVDDNDNGSDDHMGYYSGDHSNSANHPQLVVTYLP